MWMLLKSRSEMVKMNLTMKALALCLSVVILITSPILHPDVDVVENQVGDGKEIKKNTWLTPPVQCSINIHASILDTFIKFAIMQST